MLWPNGKKMKNESEAPVVSQVADVAGGAMINARAAAAGGGLRCLAGCAPIVVCGGGVPLRQSLFAVRQSPHSRYAHLREKSNAAGRRPTYRRAHRCTDLVPRPTFASTLN